jgi:transposase
MGDLSDSQRGQIVVARLAGASVTKTATLLGASRGIVYKTMSPYKDHGKKTSAKRNSGRKSTLTERDRHTLRRISSKDQRAATEQVTGLQN